MLRNRSGPILIASSSFDIENWKPVAVGLTRLGYDVVVYEADKVAQGSVPLDVCVRNGVGLTVSYDGRALVPGGVQAAWYRRSTLTSTHIKHDRARQIGLDSERKAIQAAIWSAVPETAWLNSPGNIRYADQKLTQLALADELGFSIPDTVSTNRWETISEKLSREIVFKISYVYALYCEPDDIRTVYTTPLRNEPEALPLEGNPFPGFWQSRISKAREWRITVVGSEAFDAAIYTTSDAKDDWRRHSGRSGAVEFKSEPFPDKQKELCFEYLRRFALRFGAFDFIESDDGNIVFLECNPNGQYGWLEQGLGFPISGAIASELTAIATSGLR